jgi:hypothetical protein
MASYVRTQVGRLGQQFEAQYRLPNLYTAWRHTAPLELVLECVYFKEESPVIPWSLPSDVFGVIVEYVGRVKHHEFTLTFPEQYPFQAPWWRGAVQFDALIQQVNSDMLLDWTPICHIASTIHFFLVEYVALNEERFI